MSDCGGLAVAPRFTRAIHLQRDFRDLRHRLDGYQVSPLVQQTAGRIVAGLAAGSTERAFSVIGPFGSGKSAFGVFLAHFLQRDPAARERLLDTLHAAGSAAMLPLDAPRLLAVLVPGNNGSLRQAVLAGLEDALRRQRLRAPEFDLLFGRIEAARHTPSVEPALVAELVGEAAHALKLHDLFGGLLLVVDELGQFLDYAAHHDQERDLFVLQNLAEMASRSGDAPVLFVTILHQAFERYSAHAGAARRIEWAKVQGRFADVTFQEPISQMIRMVALALRPSGPASKDTYAAARAEWAERLAPAADRLGLRPPDIGQAEWQRVVADSYPIHPTVLVALPWLFRQLAQNERSLFAFLHSDEPWGLRDVVREQPSAGELPIYRLTHLFAYVEATMGASLFGRARGQRWAELAEARASLAAAEPMHLDALTVVGTIGALERSSGLRASQAQVAFALCDRADDQALAEVLRILQSRRAMTYRRHRDSYIVWEGSDVDIDLLVHEARRELSKR
ncbi:MAG TPA: hypothetical protein VFT99_10075, partial [Roseiflexaceae bacterium]|nr:hypothetical protein [Roseiflexaceae bacterium]